MSLRPKTHGIVDVRPLRVRQSHASGQWSCSVCGRMHPVDTSWVLTFRHDDEGVDLRFVLCEPCGLERRPVRVAVDLIELEERAVDDDLSSHVQLVRSLRGELHERRLAIRDEDLERLAAQKATTVEDMVAKWEAAGIVQREPTGSPG